MSKLHLSIIIANQKNKHSKMEDVILLIIFCVARRKASLSLSLGGTFWLEPRMAQEKVALTSFPCWKESMWRRTTSRVKSLYFPAGCSRLECLASPMHVNNSDLHSLSGHSHSLGTHERTGPTGEPDQHSAQQAPWGCEGHGYHRWHQLEGRYHATWWDRYVWTISIILGE